MGHEERRESGEVGDEYRLLDAHDLKELPVKRKSKKTERVLVGLIILVAFLCGLTTTAAIHLVYLKRDKCAATYGCSYFSLCDMILADGGIAGIESVGEKWSTFQTVTEYSSDNPAIVSEAWARFVINGFVALPNSWAAERQWPAAREMPEDTDKGIYVVDGFHQLHCVVRSRAPSSHQHTADGLQMSIRETVSDLMDGKPVQNYTYTVRHLNHCYDALRQAIMCRADDTPLYVPMDPFYAGNGQQR